METLRAHNFLDKNRQEPILKTIEIKDSLETTQDFVFVKPQKKLFVIHKGEIR